MAEEKSTRNKLVNYLFSIKVDSQVVLTVPTPHEGFWNHGHFSGRNVWSSGGKNAPFDRAVSFLVILTLSIHRKYFSRRHLHISYSSPEI